MNFKSIIKRANTPCVCVCVWIWFRSGGFFFVSSSYPSCEFRGYAKLRSLLYGSILVLPRNGKFNLPVKSEMNGVILCVYVSCEFFPVKREGQERKLLFYATYVYELVASDVVVSV